VVKVAYLAPYRDGTGYAIAARNYIIAMSRTEGIDIVARPIKMTANSTDIEPEIVEAERNNLDNIDVVIQHNLPQVFEHKDGVKNIGCFAWETNKVSEIWKRHLSLMDEIWVFCDYQRDTLRRAGFDTNKIQIVPHTFDLDKYNQDFGKIDYPMFKDRCIFYSIVNMSTRKNIEDTILSYYTAFSGRDNVLLVLKHGSSGSPEEQQEKMHNIIIGIKQSMRKYDNGSGYPKIITIPGYLRDEQIYKLHNSCDVYVNTSHGESWCIPAFEAMAFGNPIIVPDYGAFKDFVPSQCRIKYVEINVFCPDTSIPDGYCGDEFWCQVDTHSVSERMRYAYHKWQDNEINDLVGGDIKEFTKPFGYEKVGQRIKELLDG
jgi:glycosyltransferase involved in cell wall biosynthesis